MMKTLATRAGTASFLERRRAAFDLPLIAALLAALALRLLLWGSIPRTGMVSDEGEYFAAASWLALGRGFAWYQDYLWTRAPLYPLFLAAHLRLFGTSPTPIYVSQTILSLANVALVYRLARRLLPTRSGFAPLRVPSRIGGGDEQPGVGADEPGQAGSGFALLRVPSRIESKLPALAALAMGLSFPFAVYTQVLLSETLYLTLLLGGFLALLAWRAGTSDERRTTNDERRTTNDERRTTEGCEVQPAAFELSAAGRRSLKAGLKSFFTRFRPKAISFTVREVWRGFAPPRVEFIRPMWAAAPPTSSKKRVFGEAVPPQTPPGTVRWFFFKQPPWSLALAGALFGLATLTRSLTLLFLPIVALWLAFGHRAAEAPRRLLPARRGLAAALLFLACAGGLIVPWTLYNSRLYGGLVAVDTSGAYNLMLGARTAYDGTRKDGPPRDFVLGLLGQRRAGADLATCAPYPGPLPTQAARQGAITREGLCLIGAKPLAFVKKTLGELIDIFQINYSGDERFTDHFTSGRLPPWYALGLFVLDDTLYVLALPLALIGWALLRVRSRGARGEGIVGLWWLYNIAIAPLLFAINRFRLPLLPFAFIFAAYALAALAGGGWRLLRARYGAACVVLAVLLALGATAPYAYLYPPQQAQALASYLGPHPSSLNSTLLALAARPRYLNTERLHQALLAGDEATAAAILASGDVTPALRVFGPALLADHQGRFADGVALLPPAAALGDDQELLVIANLVYGDLLRNMGDSQGARAALSPTLIDDANPVEWAWEWLDPAPARRIDLAGDLDLGYVRGCYLGENNPRLDGAATFRWCTDGAQLRFPGAGSGAAQTLVLRVDGRGWPDDRLPVPSVRVFVGERAAGEFTPDHAGIREFALDLPASPPGADVVVTLHATTFVPSAVDYLNQQGAQVGQVRRLGVRLDWAELRGSQR